MVQVLLTSFNFIVYCICCATTESASSSRRAANGRLGCALPVALSGIAGARDLRLVILCHMKADTERYSFRSPKPQSGGELFEIEKESGVGRLGPPTSLFLFIYFCKSRSHPHPRPATPHA